MEYPSNPLLDDSYFNALMVPYFPAPESPHIAVGVSGGSDSMALMYLADRWARYHNGQAIALIVDHGLRADSQAEALSTATQLTQHGIENHILIWEGQKPSSNIQENARNTRYALLTAWCHAHNISDLLVAHHAGDQAETLLLRLLRGSGVDGLAAMSPETKKEGVRLIRPLLSIPKEALTTLLNSIQWPWIEDPSNINEAFDRVRVRNWITHQKDSALIIERLGDTASHLSRARHALETITAQAIRQYVTLHDAGYATLNLGGFIKQPEEIGLRMLSALLRTVSGNPDIIRFEHLLSLYKALLSNTSFKGATLHGCQIISEANSHTLLVIREYAATPPHTPIIANKPIIWDQRFTITVNTSLDMPLHIAPLGQKNWLALCKVNPTLKKQINQKKLPKKALYVLPAIFTLEKIVAVPHIDYRENPEGITISCIFRPPGTVSDVYFRYNNA